MPHYDYICEACNHKFEAFHAMSAKPLVDCPECGLPELVKLIGMGSAAIIKGTQTPCRGGRTQKGKDRLGQGKNKCERPFWRDGPINKKILKNPERYIQEGKVD